MKQLSRYVNVCFLVGVVLLCLGLFVASFHLPRFKWDPVGMAFWPRVLILLLWCLAAFLLVREYAFPRADTAAEVDLRGFRLPLVSLCYAYLLEPIGFAILTPTFLFVVTLGWSKDSEAANRLRAALVAIGGTALVFVVFEVGIQVELPRGLMGG